MAVMADLMTIFLFDENSPRGQTAMTAHLSQSKIMFGLQCEKRLWLLGFGEQMEVLGPKGLREEFVGVAKEMGIIYE